MPTEPKQNSAAARALQDFPSDDQKFLDDDDLNIEDLVLDENPEGTDDEIIAMLGDDDPPAPAAVVASVTLGALTSTATLTQDNVPSTVAKRSCKNISAPPKSRSTKRPKKRSNSRCRNILGRRRRSPTKDRKTLAAMRSFEPSAYPAICASFSANSPTPFSTPNQLSTTSPNRASNDNLIIPHWKHTGNEIEAAAATAALQLSGKRATGFCFDLIPEADASAKANPTGYLNWLKVRFDLELKRSGIKLPYWFAIDDLDGKNERLHVQGAFSAYADQLPEIEAIMIAAWGEWKSRGGKDHQVWFNPDDKPLNDGWATYCLRHTRKVQKLLGQDRVYTCTRPLRAEAEEVYGEIRRIMQEAIAA